mmetsp:Transcript_29554/g.45639  ORF Transcript_29554/g.45639 Transcript_29554/m.45639 type:complete len:94 (-) Transcript_29554:207-488(-)
MKHKPVVVSMNLNTPAETIGDIFLSTPFLYMPFDTPCYLANMYGPDFMMPKRNVNARDTKGFDLIKKYNRPTCNKTLSKSDSYQSLIGLIGLS